MERFFALCLCFALSLAAANPDRYEDRGDHYRAGKKNLKVLRSRSQRAVFYKHHKGIGLFSVDSNPTGKSLSPQAWENLLHSDSAIAFARDVLFDSASQAEFIPSDRLFAKVRGSLTADGARLLAEKAGVEFVEFKSGNILGFKMTDPGADPLRAADRLSALAEVEWAQPEIFFKPRKHFLPDDPLFGRQQHLRNVGQQGGTPGADVKIAQAWDITRGDSSIVIAILDDGVQTAHPDLRIRAGGKNFFVDPPTADPNPTTAKDDHGTSVAGVAAARGNNGLGVSGAAPNAAILPIKICENEAFASNVGISDAIRYAVDAGADIINNSWGGSPFDNLLNDAIIYASTRGRGGKGCLVFCSAGNSSGPFNGLPSKRGGPMAISFSDTGSIPGTYSLAFRFSDASSVPGDTDWVAIDNISVLSGDGYTVRFSEPFAAGMPSGWTSLGTPWTVDGHYYSGTGDHNSMRSGVVKGTGALSELRMPQRTYADGDVLRVNWLLNNAKGDFQIVFYNADGIQVSATFAGKLNDSFGKFSGNADIAFPAAADSAIAVGASTEFDFRSGYSQYNEAGTGKSVDFLAPSNGAWSGVTTIDRTGTDGSTDSNYTSAFGGTSSASPLAAGVAALILSRNPQLTRVQVLAIMRATADKIGDRPYVGGRNTEYGYGRLNAYQALLAVPLPPSATTAVSPSDAAVQSSGNAMFKWNFVAGAPDYRLQLSLSPTFDVLAFDDATISDTTRLVNQLAAGVKYYWRVSAVNAGGISPWTATRTFTTPGPRGMDPQWAPTAFSPGTSVKALGLLGTHVYAGTAAGLYQTGDNGAAWALANGNLGEMIVQTMISNRDSLLIGTDAGGVGRSTDSAKNFAQIGYNATGITNYNILSLAKRGATLLAGTGGGVFRSVDNGASWKPAGHFTDSIFALASMGTDFFLGTTTGAYRSSDNGVSWTPLGGGLGGAGGEGVKALGVNGGNLFAGTGRGKVFRSPDNGATWSLTNEGWGGNAIGSFAVKGKGVFAGTVGGGVYFSPDSGESWLHINRGLTDTLVGALIANGAQVLAGTDHGGIFKYLGLPPKVTAGADQRVDEGQVLAFAVTAADPDGDAVSISLLNPPAGSTFNSATGNFSWTPSFTQAGSYALYFRGASATPVSADTDTVLVTVANVDRPPVVAGGADRFINEGQSLTFPVTAVDPDGDAVSLTLLNPPPGATFTSGAFTWKPGFSQSGAYALVFQAEANGLIGKDTVVVTVNEVDRPPHLDPIAAKSVREGDTLTFTISATDPDGDAVTYAMSGAPSGASLTNPSFTGPTLTGPNFRWNPGYSDSGHYQISFLARSRLLADTVKVGITVIEVGNGLGILRISGVPKGAIIGGMPSGSYPGGPLGKDSAAYTAKPGVYWFSAAGTGYRTSYVAGRLLLHQTTSLRIPLKPAVPLWFAAPETLRVDGASWVDTLGTAVAAADLDGDGVQDLLLAKAGGIDFLRNLAASDSVPGPYAVTARVSTGASGASGALTSAAFVDWNNSGAYDLLAANVGGSVFIVHRTGTVFTDTLPLKSFPGDTVRAFALDWDGKKDLCLHFQGKGLFIYRNTGTDAAPAFASSASEVSQSDGTSLISLASAPVWLDADDDGEKDMLAFQNDTLKIWIGKRTGGILRLVLPQPLNIGGSPFRCVQCLLALQIGAQGLPNLLVAPKDGTGLIIHSRLRGDLNGDKVVDALDLGLLLDSWKKKRTDADWIPRYNLKLNPGGIETIDEGDLGLLENDWELRE